MAKPLDQIQQLLDVAARAERKAVKCWIGHRPDPLLWALIPLYLLRKSRSSMQGYSGPLPLTGGDVARFWGRNGVHRNRGHITSALRRYIGYAHYQHRGAPMFRGWAITPNGEKYVEQAVAHG